MFRCVKERIFSAWLYSDLVYSWSNVRKKQTQLKNDFKKNYLKEILEKSENSKNMINSLMNAGIEGEMLSETILSLIGAVNLSHFGIFKFNVSF
jgi:hypothetical protein